MTQPGLVNPSPFQCLVQAVPLASENPGQAQERKGRETAGQAYGIQGFAQSVSLFPKSFRVNSLTKFDYFVNVLLGSFLFVHT